jgi:hypothetical protein
MSQLRELAGPEVRAAARFHPDHAPRQVHEEAQDVRAFEPLTQPRLAALIDAVNLKDVFCQINTDRRNVGTAWYNDVTGEENEDMCLFRFGKTYNLPNGSYANMKLGDRQYLIQRNWVNKDGGYCALKWVE